MGTYIHISDSQFGVEADSLIDAAEELSFDSEEELAEALEEQGWLLVFDDKGNVEDIEFPGEKIHADMDDIFPQLAPFVDPGSFVQFDGEAFLRYDFDGERTLLRFSDEVVDEPEDLEPEVIFGPELEESLLLGLDDSDGDADTEDEAHY